MPEKPYIIDVKQAIQDGKDAGVAADMRKAINDIAIRQSAIIGKMVENNNIIRSRFKAFHHWHLSTGEILLSEIDKLRARLARFKNR
jgi:hypothetical protein